MSRTKRKVLSAVTAGALGLGLVTLVAPLASAAPVTITIFDVNDFHGRIDNGNAPTPTNLGSPLACTIERERGAAGGDATTAFVAAGDLVGASVFDSFYFDEQPTIDYFKALDLAVSSVGNHEFDAGKADLVDRLVGENDMPYLAANVIDTATGNPILPASKTITVGGVKVAFIGAVTQETPSLVTPTGVEGLDFIDPVTAVNDEVTRLKNTAPADVYLALIHDGAADSSSLSAAMTSDTFAHIVNDITPDVSAIFTAHTHKLYSWDVPVPPGPATRPVLQAASYAQAIGKLTLTVDTAAGTVAASATTLAPTACTASDLSTYPRAAAADKIVTDAMAAGAAEGGTFVGNETADITTAFSGGSYIGGVWTGGTRDNRNEASTMGNLVANVYRDVLRDNYSINADFGVVNPGGLRAEFLYMVNTGKLALAQVAAVMPFANEIQAMTLTGQDIYDLLADQWQRTEAGATVARAYLQLGLSDNVTYSYSEMDDPDHAGYKLGVIENVTIDGKLIDKAASYVVATNSFLVPGGDNFWAFKKGTDIKMIGANDLMGMLTYLKANDPIEPDFARPGVYVEPTSSTSAMAGTGFTLDASKFDMYSLGSPQNASFDGYLTKDGVADIALGSYPVTTANTLSVAGTVPIDTPPGDYVLKLVGTPTGTTIYRPFTVTAADPQIQLRAADATSVTVGATWTGTFQPVYGTAPLTFSLVTAPAGATIDATTGTVTYTPTAAQLGEQKITVKVVDADGRSATASVVLTVVEPLGPGCATLDTELYRFYKSDGTHFYTTSASEAEQVKKYSEYKFEGVSGMIGASGATPCDGQAYLYRFYKTDGTHFYTASDYEASLVKTYPQYTFEGIVGVVNEALTPDTTPMFRFYKSAAGTHFYTASGYEAGLVKGYAEYSYEGIGYYLKPVS